MSRHDVASMHQDFGVDTPSSMISEGSHLLVQQDGPLPDQYSHHSNHHLKNIHLQSSWDPNMEQKLPDVELQQRLQHLSIQPSGEGRMWVWW